MTPQRSTAEVSPAPADLEERPRTVARLRASARSSRHVIPYRLLLLFIFLYFAIPLVYDHPAIAVLRPIQNLLILTTGWLALEKTLRGEPVVVSWPETHALVFFLFAALLSASNSYWPGMTVEYGIGLAKVIGIYIVIVNVITNRKRLRAFYWAITLGALVMSYGTWWNYTNGVVDNEGRAVYAGNFGNANELALALLIIIPLTVSLLPKARPLGRIVALGTIAACLVAMFVTFSRGGILGFLAAMAVTTVRGATPRLKAGIIVMAILGVLAFPVYSAYWERDDSFSNLEEDETFQDRVVSVQVGIKMFLDSPIVGKGLGCSFIGFADYAPPDWHQRMAMIHNTYAQVLAETGLLGTLTFFIFLAYGPLHADRVARAARSRGDLEMMGYAGAIEGSFAGFLVSGMAGPFVVCWLLYYMLGVCSALRKIAATERLEAAA